MDRLTEASQLITLWGDRSGNCGAPCLLGALLRLRDRADDSGSCGKLHAMAERGDAGAVEALKLTEDKERLIGRSCSATTSRISSASLATSFFIILFGSARWRWRP